jgi:hypothetical protein
VAPYPTVPGKGTKPGSGICISKYAHALRSIRARMPGSSFFRSSGMQQRRLRKPRTGRQVPLYCTIVMKKFVLYKYIIFMFEQAN